MRVFTTEKYGRTVIIHLSKGEKVLESVQQAVNDLGIKNGVVISAIGSLRRGAFHVISDLCDDPTNKYYTIDEPLELASAQGLIIDGEPHLHVSLSAFENVAYAGHMENGCEVQYLAELCILELLDVDLTRKLDEFGISYIDKKD